MSFPIHYSNLREGYFLFLFVLAGTIYGLVKAASLVLRTAISSHTSFAELKQLFVCRRLCWSNVYFLFVNCFRAEKSHIDGEVSAWCEVLVIESIQKGEVLNEMGKYVLTCFFLSTDG